VSELAVVLVLLGAVGLMEFGCLWFSERFVRTAADLAVLDSTLSAGHRHRLQLWWRFAPVGVTLSAACLVAGLVAGLASRSV
jgi:hypothetical protein